MSKRKEFEKIGALIGLNLDLAEKQVNECNLKAVDTLIDIKAALDGYSELKGLRNYDIFLSDYESIKRDLITGCVLKKK